MNKSIKYVVLALLSISLLGACNVTKSKKCYIKQNYKEIKKTFPNAEVTLVQDSIKVIFPNNLVFDIGSANVKPTFSERLSRFSQILSKFDKTNLLINGYTDNSGSEESNLKLSLERATNVKLGLEDYNVTPERLFTWGLGEKNPLASNNTPEGRAKNRRVEFIVLYKP